MHGVSCGPDRLPLDREECWQHYPAEGLWGYECEAHGPHAVEFAVRGGPEGPDPARLVTAERVAAHLTEFVAAAREYLAAVADPDGIQAAAWHLHGAEFGRDPADPTDTFELLLVLRGDGHGPWGVRFRADGPSRDRFVPSEIHPRQW
jgi:hypothetical protein